MFSSLEVGEIVENSHLLLAAQQLFHYVRANETGAAGNKK